MTDETSKPWTLIERIQEAEQRARVGATVSSIVAATGLSPYTAQCIKQRVRPDYESPSAFDGLKRNTRDLAE